MEPELRHLRHFVVVAEELHFRRAAERLHMAQPALSQSIKQLEQRLGVTLLERDTRNVRLTPAGAALLDDAQRILLTVNAAMRRAEAVAGSAGTVLHVGFMATAAGPVTTPLVQSFEARNPDVRVELRYFGWGEHIAAVRDGVVDVGLVRHPVPDAEGIELLPLLREQRLAVLWRDHPLASRAAISVEELADVPCLFSSSADPEWWRFWTVATRPGLEPRYSVDVNTPEEMFEAIALRRATIITCASAHDAYAHPGLAWVPVHDVAPSEVSLAWRSGPISPTTQRFIDAAVEIRDELRSLDWAIDRDALPAPV